jgi:putative FmdB family regulatory protein
LGVPLYDFECQRCWIRFEALVPAGTLGVCPECGAPEARRLLSPVAPPSRIGLRGRAARESDARRAEREVKRFERFSEERRRRASRRSGE